VKNLVLHDTAKALQRKINEAILSVGITTSGTYPKWKILEMYLNTIDYSDGNLGIEAAAENYFGLQPIKTRRNAVVSRLRRHAPAGRTSSSTGRRFPCW